MINKAFVKKAVSLFAVLAILSALVACASPAATPATTAAKTAAATTAAAPAATTAAAPVATSAAAPAATSAAAPAATTAAPAAAANAVSLKVALQTNPTGRGEAIKWWADEVTKRTGGKVKFELFWSGAMIPAASIFDGVKSGLADIGEVPDSNYPDRMPLNQIDLLPFTTGSPAVIMKVYGKIRETIPEFNKEIEQNQVILFNQPSEDNGIFFTKPLRNLAEMKGAKIRAYGSLMPQLLTSLGLVPVVMNANEAYEAMQRGTVVGGMGTLEAVSRYKWFEPAHYFQDWNLGATQSIHITINADVWNKLPKDVQQTMLAVGLEQEQMIVDIFKRDADKYLADMKKAVGFEILPTSAEDRATLKKAGQAMWDKWAKDMDAKGLQGTKVVETFKKLLAEYEPIYGKK